MNTYLTKKRLLPILALACLAPLASQNAQASTTFSSYATVTYTIESLNNSANPGDFSGLGITGSFELVPGQDFQVKTGNASVTAFLSGAGTISLVPAIGSSYSRTFQLDGTADNGGYVTASNLANFSLAFNNTSTDSYDIGLTLSYQLSAATSGNDASTEVSLNYYNEDESFSNLDTPDYINAPANILVPDYLSKTHDFNFHPCLRRV